MKSSVTILGEESPCGGYDPLGRNRCPELSRAVEGIKYIAEVTKREEDSNKVSIGRGGHQVHCRDHQAGGGFEQGGHFVYFY